MNHYYQNIHGWMNYEELYSEMVNKFPSGSRFVEIGCWVGRSACHLGVEIINSGKNIKLDCVDTWDGSDIPELANEEVVVNKTLYADFLKNVEPLRSILTPIRMKSVEASKLYEDESLDFVFIDADHTKEGFSDDMDCWFPKVKQGGVIAGHDYDYPVIKEIVNKLFNGQEKVLLPNTWVYYK
jgi:hypothetical protein